MIEGLEAQGSRIRIGYRPEYEPIKAVDIFLEFFVHIWRKCAL
jgi:hypothetical protein